MCNKQGVTIYTGAERKCALCGNEHLEPLKLYDSDRYPCQPYFAGYMAKLYACRYCGLVYIGSEVRMEDNT